MELSPQEAYKKILEDGPFDDPRWAGSPLRWHWWMDNTTGRQFLAKSEWRGNPEIYTMFQKPNCPQCRFGIVPRGEIVCPTCNDAPTYSEISSGVYY